MGGVISTANQLKTHLTVQKPPRLRRGGRIGVVAPAGRVDRDEVESGIAAIRAEGFEVELGMNLFEAKGYLAGEPQCRARDLVDFFSAAISTRSFARVVDSARFSCCHI
jgi:hypothetical protein